MRRIVHLSDLHFGRVDPRLEAPLIDAVHGIEPHLIAVSGDLTQRARRREFLKAQGFLAELPFPKLVVPGNHDVPLYNMAARLARPLGSYRRHIAQDLQPVFVDDEMIAIGLNSARAVPFSGLGRVNAEQVAQAVHELRAAPAHLVKVIVTHHPFDLPAGHDERQIIGRSHMAMEQLAEVGADLFLAGHLHVSHVGLTAERYQIANHSALVVQAGTLSVRQRGEVNAFNEVEIADTCITVKRYGWRNDDRSFRCVWSRQYRRTPEGWLER